jgi:hypothetical protein
MQACGSLDWESTERQADFLDLTITIKPNETLGMKLFEKKLNLCLCVPPHLAHLPGALCGLITGMLKRVCRLAADTVNQRSSVVDLFHHL